MQVPSSEGNLYPSRVQVLDKQLRMVVLSAQLTMPRECGGEAGHIHPQPHGKPRRNGDLQKLLDAKVKFAGCAASILHGKDLQATNEEVVE